MKHELSEEAIPFMTLANSGCRVNEISPDRLIELYYKTNFIYKAKSIRLAPYLSLILQNWNKALKAGTSLVRIITYTDRFDHTASVMLWKFTKSTWNVQHLVSSGGHISHIPMLSVKGSLITYPSWNDPKYINCWYRPDNKLPQLCFGKSVNAIGDEKISLTSWNYYECDRIVPYYTKNIKVEDCTALTFEVFRTFFLSQNNPVWWQSEDFTSKDLELNALNEEYRQVGLKRSRKIVLAFQHQEEIPSAVAICNLSSLGLNLSFLENRCLLLYRKGLSDVNRACLTHALLQRVQKLYQNSELHFIPLLVQENSSNFFAKEFQYSLIKKYNQSIWGEPAYIPWYHYIQDLYGSYSTRAQRTDSIKPLSC